MTRNSGLQDSDLQDADLQGSNLQDSGLRDIGLRDLGLPSKNNGTASSHAATEAAARIAHDFVDRVAKLAEESEDRIRKATVNAERTLKESLDTARTKSLAAKESVGDLVQRHPWAAVGIAFGVGVLLSTLARRGGDKVD
jgi:ElaB/YqjD/DUF883 family membrane-anchored ribosome-binding protein